MWWLQEVGRQAQVVARPAAGLQLQLAQQQEPDLQANLGQEQQQAGLQAQLVPERQRQQASLQAVLVPERQEEVGRRAELGLEGGTKGVERVGVLGCEAEG